MTLASMRHLAAHHRRSSENQFELAKTMKGETAENFRALGSQHLTWAEELEQLAASFETLAELTRPGA